VRRPSRGIALWIGLWPVVLAAQGRPARVEYDVEFSVQGSLLDVNCAASGTDVLTGTLTGYEFSSPDSGNVYVGKFMRAARINICGSRRNATTGTDVVCSMNIALDDAVEVMLTIEAGQREGYLQYISNRAQWAALLATLPPLLQPLNNSVTGTCDPAEMAQMEAEYAKGQTAGSPNGQPIEVPSLPPPRYPYTFAANPPVSVWTLKVLRRRP
jgi:hypothetical protein